MESGFIDISAYRQVVRFVPMDLGRPVWADDRHQPGLHVRHTALPLRRREEPRRLVARIMSQQLDRSRPLWEMWVVEGLEDGHWALISKVHHAMVDGVSGAELLSTVLDISPDATIAKAAEWAAPRSSPSNIELATDAVAQLVKSPYEQVRALVQPVGCHARRSNSSKRWRRAHHWRGFCRRRPRAP